MRIPSSAAHNRWHPDLEPVGRVAPGDVVTLETRDGLDGLLTRESTHADCARLELGLGHPLTGPVHVEGAEPGDVLEVELLAYETPSFGVNGVIPGFGFLADLFTEPFLVGWELDGTHARVGRAARDRGARLRPRGRDRRRAVPRADGEATRP